MGGSYSLVVVLFTIGWFRLKNGKEDDFKAKVSVIVAVRNEANVIEYLLEDLKKQSVSPEDFEVLISTGSSGCKTNVKMNYMNRFWKRYGIIVKELLDKKSKKSESL